MMIMEREGVGQKTWEILTQLVLPILAKAQLARGLPSGCRVAALSRQNEAAILCRSATVALQANPLPAGADGGAAPQRRARLASPLIRPESLVHLLFCQILYERHLT
jgi:hypothetical protein